jgi:hypothetical protein
MRPRDEIERSEREVARGGERTGELVTQGRPILQGLTLATLFSRGQVLFRSNPEDP